MSLRAAMSSGASDGTLVTTPVPVVTNKQTRVQYHENVFQVKYRTDIDLQGKIPISLNIEDSEYQGTTLYCRLGSSGTLAKWSKNPSLSDLLE